MIGPPNYKDGAAVVWPLAARAQQGDGVASLGLELGGDGDFASRWSQIKSGFSRGLTPAQLRSRSQLRRRETGIWQRRFWEHAIRDDADFERHVDYIHYNPVKHGYVTGVCDWPYSSFHLYVKNGLSPVDWGGDVGKMQGRFGE